MAQNLYIDSIIRNYGIFEDTDNSIVVGISGKANQYAFNLAKSIDEACCSILHNNMNEDEIIKRCDAIINNTVTQSTKY